MIEMKSSQGTTVSVSEEKAQRLRTLGYTETSKPSASESAPKKRGRPKKVAEEKSLEDMTWDDEAGG